MGVLALITVYSVLLLSMVSILTAIYHFSNWRTEAKENVEREFSLFDTTDANNKVYILKN
jgi:hypothetical protein